MRVKAGSAALVLVAFSASIRNRPGDSRSQRGSPRHVGHHELLARLRPGAARFHRRSPRRRLLRPLRSSGLAGSSRFHSHPTEQRLRPPRPARRERLVGSPTRERRAADRCGTSAPRRTTQQGSANGSRPGISRRRCAGDRGSLPRSAPTRWPSTRRAPSRIRFEPITVASRRSTRTRSFRRFISSSASSRRAARRTRPANSSGPRCTAPMRRRRSTSSMRGSAAVWGASMDYPGSSRTS